MASRPVLIIGGDRRFSTQAAVWFSEGGYRVRAVSKPAVGLRRASAEPWQAVILDVSRLEADDVEVLKALRRASAAPILLVAARIDEDEQTAYLDAGADACLLKTASGQALLAWLRAVTRRSSWASADARCGNRGEILAVADLHLCLRTRRATLGGTPLALTASEFAILLALVQAVGRVTMREDLQLEIQTRVRGGSSRGLDMQISSLRRKLGDDPKNPRFIRTIRSKGYLLVGPP